MSDYIDGWDMKDAMSRCADAEAELMKLQQRHAKLAQAAIEAGWFYEDSLPNGYPYELEYKNSKIVDGVRMFPPHICDWQLSFDGSTYVCKCGAWR